MKRTLSVPAIALAVLLLAGCSAGGSDSSAPALSNGGGAEGPLIAQQRDSVEAFGAAQPGTEALSDRAVITTGTVTITAKDPVGSASDAIKLVNGAGGRVDSRSEQPATETQAARASLLIRVPAENLDAVLEKIELLGTVNSVSLSSDDVTQQKQDIEARIVALQTSVDRLLDLMSRAVDTADLITIESALSSRQAELDSLTTQRDYLDDQIDYSTVSVDFYSEGTVAPGTPDNFWDGLSAGWNALLVFLSGFVVLLGVLIPWLVLFGVIAAIVVAIVLSARRARARRAAQRETEIAVTPQPAPDPSPAASTAAKPDATTTGTGGGTGPA